MTPEELRELINDERARRAHAERELSEESRRVAVWRQRAEERAKVLDEYRSGKRRRSRKRTASTTVVSTPPEAPAAGPLPRSPLHPTFRVATWNAPHWIGAAFDVLDLTRGTTGLESADLVFVGGPGGRGVLTDWLSWPARPPLVITAGALAEEWSEYLKPTDVIVGAPAGHATAIEPFPVVAPVVPPNETPAWRDVDATVPLDDLVGAASAGTPLRWSGRGDIPGPLTGVVARTGTDESAAKQSVLGRMTANSRFGLAAAAARIAAAADIDLPDRCPKVGILLISNRPDRVGSALDQIGRLTYPRIEVVLGLHGTDDSRAEVTRDATSWSEAMGVPLAMVSFSSDIPLGRCLNAAAEKTGAQVLAKFDDDDVYGTLYLDEAVDMLTVSQADLVGKMTQVVLLADHHELLLFQPGQENRPVGYVNGPTFVMPRRTWEDVGFAHRRARVDSTFVRGLHARGGTIQSTSRFEFALWRANTGHTWQASDDYFRARSETLGSSDGLTRFMLAPENPVA